MTFPTYLLRLPLSLLLCSAVACSGDPSGNDGDGDNSDDTASRTDLDLKAFRKHGIAKLKAHFGSDIDFSKTQMFFKDGAASTDLPPVIDLGRLVMVVDQPAVVPTPGVKIAYTISMDGQEAPKFVNADMAYFQSDEGIVVLSPDAAPAEVQELVESLEAAAPGSDIQLLDAIGLLTFHTPDGAKFLDLFEIVSSSDLADSVDLSADSFPTPFEFADAVGLGTGKQKKIVELLDSTSVTKQLRGDGLVFLTEPSLPKPFGPGRLETSFRWVVSVVEGFDTDDCAADAASFDRVELVDTAESSFTIDAPSGAASLVASLQCVASVDVESP